jgi:hypothetical protein
MYFPQISINSRVFIGLLSLSLLLIAIGGFSYVFGKDISPFATRPMTSVEPSPTPSVVVPEKPVSVIEPLIQPCLFSYFHGCSQRIAQNLMNAENRYEDFAAVDINYIMTFNQESTLLSYNEVVTPEFMSQYYPEIATISAQLEQNLTAEQIMGRVAAKNNINPRVLFTLMEVVRDGKGAVLTPRNVQTTFSDEQIGFSDQLATVAEEISASAQKYEIMKQDGTSPPRELTFFGKKYQVSDQINGETLAIVEFLGKYLKSKGHFEQAIISGVGDEFPVNNFVGLYTKLFQVSPLTNQ